MSAYRCNCEQTFPSHLARVAHAASCPVMQSARLDNHYGYCTLDPDHSGPCAPPVTGGSTPNP